MRIPAELEGARLNVTRTAELIAMDPGHLRRLIRRGVFPSPKRTAKGMPFFDHELLCQIGQVLKSGVGLSGEEISFYRRSPKNRRQRPRRSRGRRRQDAERQDAYVESLIAGCRELGIPDEQLDGTRVEAALAEAFGGDRPELEQAIPVVARQLLAGE